MALLALTSSQLDAARSTFSSKFDTIFDARPDPQYNAITERDTYGSEGYIPFWMGGVGSGSVWNIGNGRTLASVAEYGIRFVGNLYENSILLPKIQLADSPAVKAAKAAEKMAQSAIIHETKNAFAILSSNSTGFDGAALFGTHAYSSAQGAPSYSNDLVTGTGNPVWYLCNGSSLTIVDREGEGYTPQFYGGENTDVDFNKDSVALGWRARKIFAPGFWANTVRSDAPLNSANLHAARNLLATFKNDKGDLLADSIPTHLVAPRGLEAAADLLLKAQQISATTNIDQNRFQLIVTDYLPG